VTDWRQWIVKRVNLEARLQASEDESAARLDWVRERDKYILHLKDSLQASDERERVLREALGLALMHLEDNRAITAVRKALAAAERPAENEVR